MDIENEQRPAATGRCNGIALDHVQQQSYQDGPMELVDIGDLNDVRQYATRFIVDPIIPRDVVTLLSGHGNAGKSYLAATIAAHVACGQKWGPFVVTPGRVLLVTLEDEGWRVRYRLAQIVNECGLDAQLLRRNMQILDGSGIDASLADETGSPRILALAETKAFQQVAHLSESRDLVIIDNASDAFNADQN